MKNSVTNKFEFNQIDNNIYIGTTITLLKYFEQIKKIGISADIDMQAEKEDKPPGVEAFLWLPTFDFNSPSQLQFHLGANFINEIVGNNKKCYVHCRQGYGRAPTLVAAYYILYKDLTPIQAINKIKLRRPQANPNIMQVKALELLYKKTQHTHKVNVK